MINLSNLLPEKEIKGLATATGREKDDTEKLDKNDSVGSQLITLVNSANDPDFDADKVLNFIKQNTITINDKGKPSTSKGRYNLVAALNTIFKKINQEKKDVAPVAVSEGIVKYMIYNDFEENKKSNILTLDNKGRFKSKLGTNDLGGAPHVYEHMIPSNYIVSAFFKAVNDGDINKSNIIEYINWAVEHLTAIAIISKEEDNIINQSKLRDNLPGGFDAFYNDFLSKSEGNINNKIRERYKDIKLIVNKGERPLNNMDYEIYKDQGKITYNINGSTGEFFYNPDDSDFESLQIISSIKHHNKFRNKNKKLDLNKLKSIFSNKKISKKQAEKILTLTDPNKDWEPGQYDDFKSFISEIYRMQELAGIREFDEFDISDFENGGLEKMTGDWEDLEDKPVYSPNTKVKTLVEEDVEGTFNRGPNEVDFEATITTRAIYTLGKLQERINWLNGDYEIDYENFDENEFIEMSEDTHDNDGFWTEWYDDDPQDFISFEREIVFDYIEDWEGEEITQDMLEDLIGHKITWRDIVIGLSKISTGYIEVDIIPDRIKEGIEDDWANFDDDDFDLVQSKMDLKDLGFQDDIIKVILLTMVQVSYDDGYGYINLRQEVDVTTSEIAPIIESITDKKMPNKGEDEYLDALYDDEQESFMIAETVMQDFKDRVDIDWEVGEQYGINLEYFDLDKILADGEAEWMDVDFEYTKK